MHNFALDSGDIKVVSPVRNDPLTIALYGENTLNDSQIYAWNSDLEGDGAIYLTIEKSADAPSGSLSVTCSGNKWGAIMPGDLTVRGGAQVIRQERRQWRHRQLRDQCRRMQRDHRRRGHEARYHQYRNR